MLRSAAAIMLVAAAIVAAGAYRIAYRSTDDRGRSIVVTGAVFVPRGRAPKAG